MGFSDNNPEVRIATTEPNGEQNTAVVALPLELGRWAVDAACSGMDTETFFPGNQSHRGMQIQAEQEAKQVCNSCPVSTECLNYALENHEDLLGGIFGGFTYEERKKLVRNNTRRRA